MRALRAAGASPFHIEAAVLRQEAPDLVLTQDTCDICDATAADVQRALDGIQPPPQLLILRPRTVSEILESIMAVGHAAGALDRACTSSPRLSARVPWPLKPRTPTTDHGGIVRRVNPLVAGALDSRAETTGRRSGRSVQPGCAHSGWRGRPSATTTRRSW